jgi:hypothetical protein
MQSLWIWPMKQLTGGCLAELASVASVSIGTGEATVELDTAKIVAAVADALLYWPMIAPSFQVRATDDTGAEHRGMPGSGGGSPGAAVTSGSGRPCRPRRSGSG